MIGKRKREKETYILIEKLWLLFQLVSFLSFRWNYYSEVKQNLDNYTQE